MGEPSPRDNWRAVQGGLFLVLSGVASLVPGLMLWPWQLLVPITAYFVLVVAIPRLRQTLGWLKVGRLDLPVLGWTAAVIVVSVLALIVFQHLAQPDVSGVRARAPAIAF